MNLINNVFIGGDHEIFLRDKNTKEIISAEGIAKGTKQIPFNFDHTDPFACTSLDNILFEYNLAPAKTKSQYYRAIEKALKYIEKTIPEHLEIATIPAARVNEKYLQTENAKTLGCSPDFNCWTGMMNQRPEGEATNLRTGGYHVSIGYDNYNIDLNSNIVKSFELFVGVPSVIQEPENERKLLYGASGAYRDTTFGVECRSISNYILQSKKLIDWVYTNTKKAIDFINKGMIHEINDEADIIISAINNKNIDQAKYLINKFKIQMA